MRRHTCPPAVMLVIVSAAAAAFESALAPYPWRRDAPFAAAVEEVLHAIEANAAHEPGVTAAVRWTVRTERALDGGRDCFNLFSLKTCPNWHHPGEEGFWPRGEYTLHAAGGDFLIQKPKDAGSEEDWWRKAGEHLFARAFSESWHVIWRLHHDALEAGLLGYDEGLGLVLWAFQPQEYLRRAEHLEPGPLCDVGGTACTTLIATPDWIRNPYEIRNRSHYPFNQTTLQSWAVHRPVITYYVDAERDVVVAAQFQYHKIIRSSAGDWTAGSEPSGMRVFCVAEEVGETAHGTWYPVRIVAYVYDGDTVVRTTTMTVSAGPWSGPIPPPDLDTEKRTIDWWPHYRPGVYEQLVRREGWNHANRLGLARALCYEGDPAAADALREAVRELERDRRLLPATFGGVDWEFGFAVYELLWQSEKTEVESFWETLPRTSTWNAILARAVDLYRQYRPKEVEKIHLLLVRFGDTYEKRKLAQVELSMWEDYLWCLEVNRAAAVKDGDAPLAAHLKSLAKEVSAKIEELRRGGGADAAEGSEP